MDLGISEVILVGKGVTKKVYSLKGSGHRELDISNAGRNEFVKNFVTYMHNVLCKLSICPKITNSNDGPLKTACNTHHTILCCDSVIQLNLTAMAALGAEESGRCRQVLNESR